MANSRETENPPTPPENPTPPTSTQVTPEQAQEKEEKRIELAKAFAQGVAQKTKATDKRDAIINQSYDVESSENSRCDILGKYMWNIDTYKIGDVSTIPYCYLIEYKQKHNSVISNLINSISAAVTSVGEGSNLTSISSGFEKIKELSSAMTSAAAGELSEDTRGALSGLGQQVTETGEVVGQAVEDGADAAMNSQFGSGLMAALSKGWEMISGTYSTFQSGAGAATSHGGGYLKPYSQLYWLAATGKKYTFPMINELPKHKLSNSYGENNGDTSVLSSNSFLTTMTDIISDVPGTIRDLADLGKIVSNTDDNSSFSGAFVEKAKFFQYPQDTDEYTIQFPLINTVRNNSGTPEWKKNYKFIILFSLRNMIFRKDNAEYYPPLFYDLIIPGVIRQPYCYVSSVDAQPFGMTRVKECAGLFTFDDSLKSATVKVPVPEMWIVTIKLKSLIPTSANMVLSSMFDLPINNSTKNENY